MKMLFIGCDIIRNIRCMLGLRLPANFSIKTGAADARTSSARDFLMMLWRRRRVCGMVCLIMLTFLLLESMFVDPTYRSTLRMRVTSDRPTLGAFTADMPDFIDPSAASAKASLVGSQSVLRGVVQKLNFAPNPTTTNQLDAALEHLTKAIYVHPARDRDVILIDATDRNPAVAMQLANAVFDEFDRQSSVTYREQSEASLAKLREEGDRQYRAMRDAQDIVLAARAKLDAATMTGTSGDVASLLANSPAATELRERINKIRNEVDDGTARLAVLRGMETQGAYENEAAMLHDDQIDKILAEAQSADDALAAAKDRLGPNHPSVQHLTGVVTILHRRLGDRLSQCTAAMDADLNGRTQHLRNIEQQSVGAVPNSATAGNAQLAQAYDNAMLEADLQTRVYQSLRDRLQKASIEAQMPRATAQVLERPIAATLDLGRRLCDMPIIAIGLSILLAVGAARTVDWLDISVRGGVDAAAALNAPLLATLQTAPRMIDDENATHQEMEAYRMIVARLRFVDPKNEMRTLAVTSAVRGEGRSSAVANLACLYAAQGQRVLVIDTDLNGSTLHERFSVNPTPGLVDFLEGTAALDDVISPTDVANIWLTPAGTPGAKTSPTPLHISALTRQAETRFDLVIYDTPPLSQASDAAIVAREAHYVIFVARAGACTQPALALSAELLAQARCEVLGVLYNETLPTRAMMARPAPQPLHYRIARSQTMRERMLQNDRSKRTEAA